MYLSTQQKTRGPIAARAVTQDDGKPKVHVDLDGRAALSMSVSEAAELISALTTALAMGRCDPLPQLKEAWTLGYQKAMRDVQQETQKMTLGVHRDVNNAERGAR